jgi:hypothetical protein
MPRNVAPPEHKWVTLIERAEAAQPTSLEDSGTIVDCFAQDSPSQIWRFGLCHADRQLQLAGLPLVEFDNGTVNRAIECGSRAWVMRHRATGELRVRCSSCGQRTCPHCGSKNRRQLGEELSLLMAGAEPNEWRFITLTLAHEERYLGDTIKLLRSSFRKLRQTRLWRRTQSYGRAVIECKWNSRKGTWNAHLHIIARGKFLPQAALSAAWEKSSGGSYIVDVRAVDTSKQLQSYLSKYVGKVPSFEGADDALFRWCEYYVATRRKQMIITFGPCPQVTVPPDPDSEPLNEKDWELVGSLDTIVKAASLGEPGASALLAELERSIWRNAKSKPTESPP